MMVIMLVLRLYDYSKIIISLNKDIVWDNIKDDFSPFLELLREKDIDNRETEEVLICVIS